MKEVSFVLIHGGSFNAHYWDLLTPYLNGRVLAVNLPGRCDKPANIHSVCIQDWVDSVVEDIISGKHENIILVGHSLAGITIPGVAAELHDRIKHIVYSSCCVPAEGKKNG